MVVMRTKLKFSIHESQSLDMIRIKFNAIGNKLEIQKRKLLLSSSSIDTHIQY